MSTAFPHPTEPPAGQAPALATDDAVNQQTTAVPSTSTTKPATSHNAITNEHAAASYHTAPLAPSNNDATYTEHLTPASARQTARPPTSDDTTLADPSAAPSVSPSTEPSTNEKTPDHLEQAASPPFPDGPPPLPYNLREHKVWIAIFWFLIFAESTAIPVVFYFTISRLTDMRLGAMFAIITAMFGFISGGEYGLRGLRLVWKGGEEYRPLKGGQRWHFDSVHLVLGQPYFVMTALMIGFSIPDPPMIRGLSIIMPVGIIMVVVYMMYTGVAHHLGWRLKWHRLSSHVVGDVTPPLTFCIMEDITACDGGGGKAYREAALARFNASPRFRRMLVQLLWAWSISGLLMSIVLIILAWTIHPEVAYTLGWGVPSIWGVIGAFCTIKWCQRCLRIEKEMWAHDHSKHLRQG